MFWFRDKRTLVQRYTADLAQITTQIHDLDKSIKHGSERVARLQRQVTYFGLSAITLLGSYMFLNYTPAITVIAMAGAVAIVVIVKLLLSKMYQVYHQYRIKKLSQLRGLHQKKLDKLKEETNYNATSSIIQRFSSGETQSEDAVILMDEEISKKYNELTELQKQLTELKQNEKKLMDPKERDVWFDKVLGVLSGGDEMAPKPIICTNCNEHCGAYRLLNRPLKYVCPNCGIKIDETAKMEQAVNEEVNEDKTK
ncbi:putative integral membrane zinc-ribbon metal-binding protein [Nakaseomyces glabratus]|nr:hypothetical protein LTX96_0000305 [Nakaseomyces glabratus]